MANIWIEKGIVSEMCCGSNFAYLLDDSSDFLSTEYKVLHSRTDDTFIKCMKMQYNGKTQLYYLTGICRSLASMLPDMESDTYYKVVADLISKVIGVKNIGFLPCQNIVLDTKYIYVDPGTLSVSLVYLPVRNPEGNDILSFENQLRSLLVKQMHSYNKLNGPKTSGLIGLLQDGTLSLESLLEKLKDGRSGAKNSKTSNKAKAFSPPRLTLSSEGCLPEAEVRFLIEKTDFVLGRDASQVTGIIPEEYKKVGRTHCRIEIKGDSFFAVDIKSKNGTFLNNIRLEAEKPTELKDGDILRLADLELKVTI